MKVQSAFLVFVSLFACCIATAQVSPNGGSAASRLQQKPNAHKAALAVADTRNNRVLIFNAPLKPHESASLVLGQLDFVHGSANQGNSAPAANTLAYPVGVAQGPNGELFVADSQNCRVLRFDPPFNNGVDASLVFGEPDFVARNCFNGTTADASSLSYPNAVALDDQGDLWVADGFDSRVLEYVPPFSNGMAATLVLGQTTTGASWGCNQVFGGPPHFAPTAATSSTFCGPGSLSFDSAGNLWIADFANNRVLEFVPPFSTGMSASLILGSFMTNTPNECQFALVPPLCGPTASTLFFPTATAFDSAGNLWVADSENNRVLEYVPPFSNGMDASLVLGQPDFTSGGTGIITGYLNSPEGLAFEQGTSNLLVSDDLRDHVLIFEPPFSNNMSPDGVIGHAGHGPRRGKPEPTTASSLNTPTGVAALQ